MCLSPSPPKCLSTELHFLAAGKHSWGGHVRSRWWFLRSISWIYIDQSNLRMAHRSKLDQIKKDLHKLETTHQRLKSIAIYCAEAIERRFQPQTPEGSNTKWCCRYLYFLKKTYIYIYIIYYIIRSSAESFRFWTFLWGRGLYCLHKICHVQSLRWNHPCRGPWNQLIDRFNQRS